MSAIARIEQHLATIVDVVKGDRTVDVPLDEYMRMRKVYDENKDQKYLIELHIYRHQIIVQPGEEPVEISCLHTKTCSFPDDTESNLTAVYSEVNENSKYLEYVEAKLDAEKRRRAEAERTVAELKAKLDKRSWMARLLGR